MSGATGDSPAKFYSVILTELKSVMARRDETPWNGWPFANVQEERDAWDRALAKAADARKAGGAPDPGAVEEKALIDAWEQEWQAAAKRTPDKRFDDVEAKALAEARQEIPAEVDREVQKERKRLEDQAQAAGRAWTPADDQHLKEFEGKCREEAEKAARDSAAKQKAAKAKEREEARQARKRERQQDLQDADRLQAERERLSQARAQSSSRGQQTPEQRRAEEKSLQEEEKQLLEKEEQLLDKARADALDLDLVGLAFSGGGIRSATFGLGVLQGLADLGLLKRVDYLSTVSGGGYVGSWLAAWVKREGNIGLVEKQLRDNRIGQAGGRLQNRRSVEEEPEPIFHLRSYSNYLAPRLGLLSADSWVLVSLYVRNFLLNLLLLIPAVMAVLLLSRWLLVFINWEGPSHRGLWHVVFGGLGILGLLCASGWIIHFQNRLSQVRAGHGGAGPEIQANVVRLHYQVLLPLLGTGLMAAWFAWEDPDPLAWQWVRTALGWLGITVSDPGGDLWQVQWLGWVSCTSKNSCARPLLMFGGFFGVLIGLVHAIAAVFSRRLRDVWWIVAGLLAGFVCGVLLNVLLVFFQDLVFAPAGPEGYELAAVATLVPPAILLLFLLGTVCAVGVLGRGLTEDQREWWASLGGWVMTYAFAWAAVFGISLYGVPLLIWAGPHVRALLGTGWLATAIGGVLAGKSPRTGSGKSSRPLELLAQVGPYVFIVGLLVVMSWLVSQAVDTRPDREEIASQIPLRRDPPTPPTRETTVIQNQVGQAPLHLEVTTTTQESVLQTDEVRIEWQRYWDGLLDMDLVKLAAWTVGCLLVLALASRRIDVNLFSMHATYGNRLIRCYLGASRPKLGEALLKREGPTDRLHGAPANSSPPPRHPNPITGFDPNDDFPLHGLVIGPSVPAGGNPDLPFRRQPYHGPYYLVNTALNLVEGDELAWQERKAESFVLTPCFCGSKSTGYRPLPPYGDNVSLGTAVTLSGAAASPNMGYHSSPAVTALLTVFDVRLGGWFGNPHEGKWRFAGPRVALVHLLKELFGRTNLRSQYVYLSDGGHFENLGVYELVRRHCRYIIACDGGQDAGYQFFDLGDLIRKCRTDLGVPIEIDVTPIQPTAADGHSRWHCAIGRIRYDQVDPQAVPGMLVYLKASLTGDEPSDVLNYAVQHPPFPHQTTANQFFTESQFESYRALGHHIVGEVFGKAVKDIPHTEEMSDEAHRRVVRPLFSNLHRRWFPPPPQLEASFLESVKGFVELEAAFRTDENLRAFSLAMYPEVGDGQPTGTAPPAAGAAPALPGSRRSVELHAVNQMLQVMENAWLGLHLEGYFAHPLNRGWMNVFRRWTSTAVFQKYWLTVRGEYSQDFVSFCESELNLDAGEPKPLQTQPDALRRDPRWAGLQQEFAREWPDEAGLNELLQRAGALSVALPLAEKKGPPLWMVALAPKKALDGEPGAPYPCGVVLAWEPTPEPTYELLVWIRGAYRNLGIGRKCLDQVLGPLAEGLKGLATPPKRLRVRFPRAARLGGENRMLKAMWLSFFYHHGFRKQPVDEASSSEDLILISDLDHLIQKNPRPEDLV